MDIRSAELQRCHSSTAVVHSGDNPAVEPRGRSAATAGSPKRQPVSAWVRAKTITVMITAIATDDDTCAASRYFRGG